MFACGLAPDCRYVLWDRPDEAVNRYQIDLPSSYSDFFLDRVALLHKLGNPQSADVIVTPLGVRSVNTSVDAESVTCITVIREGEEIVLKPDASKGT